MAEIKTADLAHLLGLPLRGDPERLIGGAAVLEEATRWQLAFVGSAKHFGAGRASRAGCLIAPPDFDETAGQTVIESPQPRAHFAQALAALFPPAPLRPGISPHAFVHERAFVHPTAEIGPHVAIAEGASIAESVRIGAGCSIGPGAIVGPACVLYPHVTVYGRLSIGARCIIHSGAVIGADGFGFEFAQGRYRKVPQVGTVEIGDDVEIGANTCIDRATLGSTVVGEGTRLDNMVHIAHNCRIGKHVVIAAQTGFAGGVVVGDYAIVGGQVGVGDKARIESKAVIGSGAGILTSKIVRAGEPVWGTPARPLRQYLEQLATLARLSKRRGKPGAP
jgi:UDP-3-O-[3-hydroxymyristoyl] glucosamine N-acyltransferase